MLIFAIVAVLVAAAVVTFVLLYNRLIKLRQRVKAAYAQIDVQLKRRYDLIPNLVESVKGYAAHEADTLQAVTNARAAAVGASGVADVAAANGVLTNALGRLFAVSEAYPTLRANENFLQLQHELTATEDRISFSRQHYNDSVMEYNTAIETFPSSLAAGPAHATPEVFFELPATDVARDVPNVRF
ncbi:MAG: LemA protein [Frankiaceae bacterium]|nr:LemA protein [Frankiaceae bacterium]